MTRQFTPVENPDLGSVWVWFESQSALLAEERLMMLARAGSGDGSALRAHQIQFVGLTTVEIADFFDTQRTQLELLTMFELLAVTEATLRLEFQSRVRLRKKDSLSRRFRRLNREAGGRVRLDEEILDALGSEGLPPSLIGDFCGTLGLRNWLAHGRYWHPKPGRRYTPADLFDTASALLKAIPAS